MLKTTLIIVLVNLASPNEPAKLIHRAFPTEVACQKAYLDLTREIPSTPLVKVAGFCVGINDLADEDAT